MIALVSVLSIGLLAPAAGVAPGATIEAWSRGAKERKQIRLDDLPLETVEHRDLQLQKSVRVRGIALGRLLAALPADKQLDLVLLHFANGMVVPLPNTNDAALLTRLDAFVARQIEDNGVLLAPGTFPSLARAPDRSDVRPRSFGGNRLLVADRWHPLVPSSATATFSPWEAVDTLVGIERTKAATYWAQFDVPRAPPAVQRGAQRYRESCLFCHSANGVGGRFGWDFLDPDPIYSDRWMRTFRDSEMPFAGTTRPKEQLSTHVRFHAGVGQARAMPVLSHLQKVDVDDLWAWINALAAARRAP